MLLNTATIIARETWIETVAQGEAGAYSLMRQFEAPFIVPLEATCAALEQFGFRQSISVESLFVPARLGGGPLVWGATKCC